MPEALPDWVVVDQRPFPITENRRKMIDYLLLGEGSNEDGYDPSEVAAATGLKVQTCRRGLAKLAAAGWLAVQRVSERKVRYRPRPDLDHGF